ncbi:Long-chain-fatty-acid--CoA ligase FadD13 [Zhongshania aliphaticivorans]|uniref:Long-chain-fatty-acid--CoA ligase FadD13 n=1 Tax=Zhongshania aliphaticivorans TaxID=1470434 RepID=A0A5S9PJJ3_9GAMM|nr:AMP-binding protein [Zhongshania aliphaticivorans]CAA0104129.1 Long-chain-fatty-acid--CoA ligase FadD13 [Zhongshania aliphaticivorans]CAA0104307.1 Long-chain-fatty-acid--CoA ligase FadD13 [Zhongshania aliphaticivorans]
MNKIRAYSGIVYHAQYFPDTTAVTDDIGSYSYRELLDDALRTVSAFRQAGLMASDRVAMASDNRYEAIVLILSGLLGGPVIVPVNRRMSAAEMMWVITHSQAKILVCDSEAMSALTAVEGHGLQEIQCMTFEGGGTGLKSENKPFLSWLRTFTAADFDHHYQASRPYLQVYTSGTSGKPKGVVLTEENCLGQLSSLLMCLDVSLARGDSFYEGLPLFHVGGIMVTLLALSRGLALRFLGSFNPSAVLDMICTKQVVHVALVPAMIQACQNGDRNTAALQQLQTIMYGASPITETLLRNAKTRYQCDFFQIYGMTETHSVITVLGSSDHEQLFANKILAGTAGKPVPGAHLQIVDDQGVPLTPGQPGEIRVSCQHTMSGYWQNEAATNETVQEGYLYTGDVGFINDHGFLYIMDRKKDLIISGGENVSSLEVESALMAHPDINDVAVIGLPDERWGEMVTAVVVRSSDSVSEQDILAFSKNALAGFKTPKRIIFSDVIPRNANGKILKKNLRETYQKD